MWLTVCVQWQPASPFDDANFLNEVAKHVATHDTQLRAAHHYEIVILMAISWVFSPETVQVDNVVKFVQIKSK